jgi:phosphatidylserine/phosphatidylglycerophosphate/cardiolipin synthase-like enzyme
VLDPRLLGSHAKFCVSDGVAAYIGSANLTGPGLAGHIELGVLVRGPVAKQVEEFWMLCHQLGLFIEV